MKSSALRDTEQYRGRNIFWTVVIKGNPVGVIFLPELLPSDFLFPEKL
jgi:hypothetical protein